MSDFKEDLKEFLTNNIPTGRVVSGGREFVCRCPICGDSKNIKSAHFYINLPSSDEVPVMYNCYKCNSSGILNRDILRKLGIDVTDEDIILDLIKRHKRLNGNFIRGSDKNRRIYKFNINNDYIYENKNNKYKMDYINKRLGLNLTYQDILDCKIILNLYDIYNNPYNRGKLQYTRSRYITNELNDSFIGFLGYNNAVINMRNLKDKKDYNKYLAKRYANYNLLDSNKIEGTSKYYIIPATIDVFKHVKIHIAEGPFDILSIFFNLNNASKDNSIYASIEGKSYINLINFLLSDLRIIDAEIHIYFDNDVSKREISGILEQLQYLNIDVYFHWNKFKDEKDYGVPKDRILDYSEHVIKR